MAERQKNKVEIISESQCTGGHCSRAACCAALFIELYI